MCKLHIQNDAKCRKEIIRELKKNNKKKPIVIHMWNRGVVRGIASVIENKIHIDNTILPEGLIGMYHF
jgi:L-ribulose-5-phosphate 3-epimerase UlaE